MRAMNAGPRSTLERRAQSVIAAVVAPPVVKVARKPKPSAAEQGQLL